MSPLGSVKLVGGYADPLVDENTLRDPGRIRKYEEVTNLLFDRLNVIFPGALAPGHPRSAVLVEDVKRHRSESMIRVQGVFSHVSGSDARDGCSGGLGYSPVARSQAGGGPAVQEGHSPR